MTSGIVIRSFCGIFAFLIVLIIVTSTKLDAMGRLGAFILGTLLALAALGLAR